MAFNWYKSQKNHYNKELYVYLYKLITQWCCVRGCICTKSCQCYLYSLYSVLHLCNTY